MNKYIKLLTATVFILGICLMLSIYFEYSNLSIAVLIGLGLIGGISSRFFIGYFNPSRLIFRSRFIIYGIGTGVLIGFLLFLTNSIKIQSFAYQDLVKWLFISIAIGIAINGTLSYLRFKRLRKRTICDVEDKDSISDFAIYTDSQNNTLRGRLLLSNNKLSFYSMANGECIFEKETTDINPTIRNAKFLGIPNGFDISNETIGLNVAFPHYWIKLIETER